MYKGTSCVCTSMYVCLYISACFCGCPFAHTLQYLHRHVHTGASTLVHVLPSLYLCTWAHVLLLASTLAPLYSMCVLSSASVPLCVSYTLQPLSHTSQPVLLFRGVPAKLSYRAGTGQPHPLLEDLLAQTSGHLCPSSAVCRRLVCHQWTFPGIYSGSSSSCLCSDLPWLAGPPCSVTGSLPGSLALDRALPMCWL